MGTFSIALHQAETYPVQRHSLALQCHPHSTSLHHTLSSGPSTLDRAMGTQDPSPLHHKALITRRITCERAEKKHTRLYTYFSVEKRQATHHRAECNSWSFLSRNGSNLCSGDNSLGDKLANVSNQLRVEVLKAILLSNFPGGLCSAHILTHTFNVDSEQGSHVVVHFMSQIHKGTCWGRYSIWWFISGEWGVLITGTEALHMLSSSFKTELFLFLKKPKIKNL